MQSHILLIGKSSLDFWQTCDCAAYSRTDQGAFNKVLWCTAFLRCKILQYVLLVAARNPEIGYFSTINVFVEVFTCRVSGQGNRISAVRLSFCVCVCLLDLRTQYLVQGCTLCVSIHHGKRTLGRRNFTTRVTGGASTLSHFHLQCYH